MTAAFKINETMFRRSPSTGALWLVFIVFALGISGCSEPKFYPTKGQVIIYGVGPLTEGEIRFRPVSRPDLVATGKIQKDGSFSVSTPSHGEGVLEGDCKVAIIVEPRGGKRLIAERFGDYDTADINQTITPRDENYFILQVTR